ncbi:hypothetical protein FACS189415_1510 [Bacteroidia bacterium]|nr:hypothetical protein FACS189415_1510 [Bacteroidia bacterium]
MTTKKGNPTARIYLLMYCTAGDNGEKYGSYGVCTPTLKPCEWAEMYVQSVETIDGDTVNSVYQIFGEYTVEQLEKMKGKSRPNRHSLSTSTDNRCLMRLDHAHQNWAYRFNLY